MLTSTTPSRAKAWPSYIGTAEFPLLKAPPWIHTITGRLGRRRAERVSVADPGPGLRRSWCAEPQRAGRACRIRNAEEARHSIAALAADLPACGNSSGLHARTLSQHRIIRLDLARPPDWPAVPDTGGSAGIWPAGNAGQAQLMQG